LQNDLFEAKDLCYENAERGQCYPTQSEYLKLFDKPYFRIFDEQRRQSNSKLKSTQTYRKVVYDALTKAEIGKKIRKGGIKINDEIVKLTNAGKLTTATFLKAFKVNSISVICR
jgi:hypothetical protein